MFLFMRKPHWHTKGNRSQISQTSGRCLNHLTTAVPLHYVDNINKLINMMGTFLYSSKLYIPQKDKYTTGFGIPVVEYWL